MMVCGTRRWHRRGHGHDMGFGMMGVRARFFGPGEVRLALLSLIANGAERLRLMHQLQEALGEIYNASAGTVYPTLQQLEDRGLIRPTRRKASAFTRSPTRAPPNSSARTRPCVESGGGRATGPDGVTRTIRTLRRFAARPSAW